MQKYKMMLVSALVGLAMIAGACATSRDNTDATASGTTRATASPTNTPATVPDQPAQPIERSAATLSDTDRDFIMKAAQGGKMEVQLGQLAADKASNSDVKQFAQRMVDDHSRANEELMRIASQYNVTVSDALTPEAEKTHHRLATLSGAAFDREYMSHMVKDHNKDVAEFEKVSNQAGNADLKNFASKTLPTLREHLQLAKDTAKKVGAK